MSSVTSGEPRTASIVSLMLDTARANPDSVAVTCEGRSVTWGDLIDRSRRLASVYAENGVTSTDVVAIALPNGIDFVEATLAAWFLGATPLPLSWRFPLGERQAIVDLADARLVIGVEAGTHESRACLPAGVDLDGREPVEIDPDLDVSGSFQITTSGGSTGLPKLIISKFTLEIAAGLLPAMGQGMGMRPGGMVLVPTPLYHGAGFQFTWCALLSGAPVTLLPKFDATATLDAIEREKVTWSFMVPTMLGRLLKVLNQDGAKDLSSLEFLWHGAGPCPAWVKEGWIELIGAEKVMELYGAGEGAVGAVISGVEWLDHRGSVGKPIGGEVRILDDEGNECPLGEVGEIWMLPAAGSPEKATVVGATMRVRDGWSSVGDVGWLDADGYLYISDRRVDMIVSGGANVFPAEVEAALVQHAQIHSAVVVGLPDDDLGQKVHAVVQVDGDLSEQAVFGFLAERLVRYKVPRSLRFVSDPLQDDAGKARRSAIREEEISRMAGDGQ